MRFDGIVKTWNDDRGFGFIEPLQGGQEIFVHIKAFPSGTGRPTPGLPVSFELEMSADGKKRAKNVQFARPTRAISRRRDKSATPWGIGSIAVLGGFAFAYLLVTLVYGTSKLFALGYLGMSLVSVIAYWLDKNAAQNGQWRIPESTLLMLGLAGGWPGAIVAQQTLRHKTTKQSFRSAFWVTVVLNVGAFMVVTTPLLRFVLR